MRTKKYEHIMPVLNYLHWLPVKYRIDFKILLTVYKSLNGAAPPYVSDILTEYTPDRHLRSSCKALLNIPHIYSKSAQGAFSYYGPMLFAC